MVGHQSKNATGTVVLGKKSSWIKWTDARSLFSSLYSKSTTEVGRLIAN